MPSFITSEMEKANIKFIELVKKYPCIWNKDAPNYNVKQEMDKAWNKISKDMDDTPRTCLIHWQKIRRAFARSFKVNANGSYQKSEYYMASALEFVRPHLKLGCSLTTESVKKEKVSNDADESCTSMVDIEIKDEPDDSDGGSATAEDAEYIINDIIKMEDEAEEKHKIQGHKSESAVVVMASCSKRKSKDDSIEVRKTKETKEQGDKNDHPNLCLIDANRKFFESLIPFIDDMNTQQNRRFRREIMCLIDDVLDDRDINDI